MPDPPDYTREYRDRIRPEINRQWRKVLLSFIGCVLLLIIVSKILEYFSLPDKLIFLLFFPCAAFYLHQIFSFKNITCPHCGKPLFVLLSLRGRPLLFKSHVSKRCPHCSARFR
jgi:hypothetical protein